MKFKDKKITLLFFAFILFFMLFFSSNGNTFGIYRDVLKTKVYLTVLDPNTTHIITFNTHGGTPVPAQQSRGLNETAGTLPSNVTMEGYNFLGWYDNYPNGNPITADTPVTSDVTYHAHWVPIVCKKATQSSPLHTETCLTGGSCLNAGYSLNNTITYGTYPGSNSPLPGDAYDCDVKGNGTYERFYYIRENTDNDTFDNAVLVYYSSVDANGNNILSSETGATYKWVDTEGTPASDVLPDSSLWSNTVLKSFDSKVSRFLSVDDLEVACGTSPIGSTSGYLISCQYLMENSRFQSSSLGRSGIWVEPYNNKYYRMHTGQLAFQSPDNGANSENTVRPVIEISVENLEGYQVRTQYRVTFHFDDDVTSNLVTTRYAGQVIGSLPTPNEREGYTFDGWFTDNSTYTTEVTPSTIITGTTHVYAKWDIFEDNMKYVFHIPGTCRFNGANSDITSPSDDCISTINPTGENIDYTESSNRYIDTQIPLYSDANYDLDYEIGFTINEVNLSSQVNQAAFVNAKLENSSIKWPGLVFRRYDTSNLEITQTINTKKAQVNNLSGAANLTTSDPPIDVRIYRKDKVISFSYNGGAETVLQDISNVNRDIFDFYTWFGAGGKEENGGPTRTDTTSAAQRHLVGTMSNMYIKLYSTEKVVTFDAGQGTASFTSKKVNSGSEVGELPTVTRTMYRFDGWYTKPNGQGGAQVTTQTIITNTVTFYAHYTPLYLVTFDPGTDGTLSIAPTTTITVASGETITEWPTATKQGVIFDGWLDSQDNLVPENVVITSDVTFHAKYISIRRVDFNAHGGTLTPNTSYIEIGEGQVLDINDFPNASLTGYVFNGWWTDETSGTQITTSQTITQDTIYHAQYKKIHTITFDPDGGELSIAPDTTINVTDGESIGTNNLPTATLYGYHFDGWFSQTGTGGTQYYGTETITADDTYHAQWSELTGETRTVTFYDGETVIDTVDVIDGNYLGPYMISDPTKTDYFFNGWYINGNQMTPFTSDTIVTGGNLSVMASWIESVKLANISSNPDPFLIKLGTTGQIILTPTAGDLVEEVSYTSSDSNVVEIDDDGTVHALATGTATITLTGSESNDSSRTIQVTVHNSNVVTFDPDNGNPVTTILVPTGSTIGSNLPGDPTKTNYIFDNWYLYNTTNDEFTDTVVDINKTINSDETYKASWAENTKVAAIGRTYYESLALAFEAAPITTETTVKVLQDIPNITCLKDETPNACSKDGRTTVPAKKNIVLIGGNYTMSTGPDTVGNVIVVSGKLRIKSGTYISNKVDIAPLETNNGATLYIDGGTVSSTNNRGAVYNSGNLEVNGGTISTGSSVTIRPVLQNAGKSSTITINGGTIIQYATSVNDASGKDDGRGTIAVTYLNTDCASVVRINGGTIISYGTNSSAIRMPKGTLTIGKLDTHYNVESPVIQGELYGVESSVNYSVYDGIIKGVGTTANPHAVNDTNMITGYEVGSVIEESTEDNYYTLYFALANNEYRINFNATGGEVSDEFIDYPINEEITLASLATATRINHTFGGWYIDSNYETPATAFTPTTGGATTYYAKWTFNSSYTPVSVNTLSDAMNTYFNNISSWISTDATDPSNNDSDYNDRHALFNSSMMTNFTNNNCSSCNEPNGCSNPTVGTYCDQPIVYETGLTENINVYLYDENAVDKKGAQITYATSNNGIIYNLIPGKTYLWESSTDSSKYGVISATGQRRTLKVSGVRNVRDLGGLAVSYTDLSTNQVVTGTIDYGRLYRGAKIDSTAGVNGLTKLGITSELDVREDKEAGSYYLNRFDTGTFASHPDLKVVNYQINPTATAYLPEHSANYNDFKLILRKTMEEVINGENVFIHCSIGADRTGTIAYFIEGLLGVSEEDRLRDYDMTYYFGLTNRTRFHDYLSGSKINPRFESMYKSYPTNQDIYNLYKYSEYVPAAGEYSDDELLTRFRNAVINH